MFNNGRKSISFKTEKQESKSEFRKRAVIIAAGFAVILIASLIFTLSKNDFSIRAALGGSDTEETTSEEKTVPVRLAESDDVFLVWSAAKDRSRMSFMWLVRAGMPQREITVCTVDPQETVSIGGKNTTFESIFARSGEKDLVAAMEAYSGLEIDRYIGATDENFKAFINYVGGIDVEIEEQVDYKSDEFNLVLTPGMQSLKGDTFYKYILYSGYGGAAGRINQGKVFGMMLESIFTEKNESRKSNIFSKISNTLGTNITIVDFSEAENGITEIMKNGFSEIRSVSVPDELSEGKK